MVKNSNRPKSLATDDSSFTNKEVSKVVRENIFYGRILNPFFNESDYLDFLIKFLKQK